MQAGPGPKRQRGALHRPGAGRRSAMFRPSYVAAARHSTRTPSRSSAAAVRRALGGQAGRDPDRHGSERARPAFSPNAKAVFEMIRTHALQGMFGDPAHGGNVGLRRAGSSCASPGLGSSSALATSGSTSCRSRTCKSTYSLPLFRPATRRTEMPEICSRRTSSSSASARRAARRSGRSRTRA